MKRPHCLSKKGAASIIVGAITLSSCAHKAAPIQRVNQNGLTVEAWLKPDPPRAAPESVYVQLRDTLNRPVSGALIEVRVSGNRAAQVDEGFDDSPGRYVVPLFIPSVKGQFIFTVTATEDRRRARLAWTVKST